MAGFRVIKSIVDASCEQMPISSQTLAVGDLIELIPGEATKWTPCTASSLNYSRKAICMEAATSSATSVLAQKLFGNETVAAESNAVSAVADNGNLMLLTDKNTVNNTGTNSTAQEACFFQTGTLGATTDYSIVGHVMVGFGVDPAAT
jgi:hypothetical protein